MSIPTGGRGHEPNVKRTDAWSEPALADPGLPSPGLPSPGLPELIAHRGAPREARENTIAAFERALARRAVGLELDVHLTADGTPVVHHDRLLAAGTGPLAGRAIAALSAADLTRQGGGLSAPLPTLHDVATLVAGRAILYVELKGGGAVPAVDAVHAVHAVLARAAAASSAGVLPYAIHAFDHRVARWSATVRPDVPVGVLSESYLVDTVGALRAARARDLWQHWSQIDAALVDAVHGVGGRVVAWTVDDADVARTLAELRVDALCTNDVPLVRAALARG